MFLLKRNPHLAPKYRYGADAWFLNPVEFPTSITTDGAGGYRERATDQSYLSNSTHILTKLGLTSAIRLNKSIIEPFLVFYGVAISVFPIFIPNLLGEN
jgi:hypothetical protein